MTSKIKIKESDKMTKFIEIDERIINIDEIASVKYLGDDIYEGLFPKENGVHVIDYIAFKFAEIKLKNGELIDVNLGLYAPEKNEEPKEWSNQNMYVIRKFWNELRDILKTNKLKTERDI